MANILLKHIYRYMFILFIVIACVMCIMDFDSLFIYPEENFQILEAEVNRMISSKDFNTEYELELKYNNQSNRVEFQLDGYGIYVAANIDNYGEDNQTITVNRQHISIFDSIMYVLVFSLFMSYFILIAFAIILYIILCILKLNSKYTKK